MIGKSSQKEVLTNARRLVQEAVDVANRAGIDPSQVVAAHCAETKVTTDNGTGQDPVDLEWCGVPVIIDNNTRGLFEMAKPDNDPAQKPAFAVTQSTANLVRQDFERYKPSLERMVEDWREAKKSLNGPARASRNR
ncbi:MAG: hypothetical protein ACR2H4_08820 [Pyrinomonadaceae bacterium]